MGVLSQIGALLGISAYEAPPAKGLPTLDSPQVKAVRKALGGQLVPLYETPTRLYLADLESASHAADQGMMAQAAAICRSIRRDGVVSGLLATRTSGLVRLPKRFRGNKAVKQALERADGITCRSVFDDLCPSSELALIAADGILLGVGFGMLVPVEGREFRVLVRVDPQALYYQWNENRWYFMSAAGRIPITPGDGTWVMHVPGGRMSPWQHGLWLALGQAYIQKQHAMMHRANFSAKLANPARVATSPIGASDDQAAGWLEQVMGWSTNSTFQTPPGYDVKILETNGQGFKVFKEEIETCDNEMVIALAGQTVTTDGGTGFANADIHKSIRADLIKETADALAYTINTQVLPQFVVETMGEDALEQGGATVEWDVTPPKDNELAAKAVKAFGEGLTALTAALQPYGLAPDVASMCVAFNIPLAGDETGDGTVDVESPLPEPAEDADAVDVEFDEEDTE